MYQSWINRNYAVLDLKKQQQNITAKPSQKLTGFKLKVSLLAMLSTGKGSFRTEWYLQK